MIGRRKTCSKRSSYNHLVQCFHGFVFVLLLLTPLYHSLNNQHVISLTLNVKWYHSVRMCGIGDGFIKEVSLEEEVGFFSKVTWKEGHF